MHKYYDFRNVDSVSVTLVFISIITVIYIVYNFIALLRKECCTDEGTAKVIIISHFVIINGILCIILWGVMRDVSWDNYFNS
jgi:hypothetical protein